jgi:hypothetical protein
MKNEPTEKRRVYHPGKDSDIEIDPEFESLIPPLSRSELADLHRSLDNEGCRDALIVWKGQNKLVNGHNRIRHCREKQYPYPVIEKEFIDRDAVKAYIIHEQLGRRNLSPGAESYLRGKRYLETKQQGTRSDLTSGQSDQKSTAEQLAEEFNVGEKTIRREAKFAEAVDQIAENCGQEVKQVLLSRETGLTRGGILRLAKLKPEEQKRFLQQLKESGKRPRKARKKGKRERITIPSRPKQLVVALLSQLGPKDLAQVLEELAAAVKSQGDAKGQDQESERPGKRKAKAAK